MTGFTPVPPHEPSLAPTGLSPSQPQESDGEARLSIRRANWGLLFAVVGFLLCARLLARRTGLNPYWAEVPFFGLLPLMLVRRDGARPSVALRLNRFEPEQVGLAVGVYALSLLVVMAVAVTTLSAVSALGYHEWDPGGNPLIDYAGTLNQSLFYFAVIPAVCEEMFFRGYLLRSYSQLGVWRAVIMNSLLFGLLHGSVIRLPITFTIGVILSLLALKTGSLIPSMVVHFVNNAVAVTLANGLSRLFPQAGAATTAARIPPVPPAAVAIVCAVGLAAAVAIWAIVRPERPFPRPPEPLWPALKRSLLALPVLVVEAFYLFLNFRGLH